ncbi:MAG: hypothetical protein Q9218_001646 [Villophora microphyllina]
MGSQFSLSLELTKLVPFGSLVNAAGHGLVRLLRDIQTSGSDFVAEHDLAEAFGRNQVEPLFASTFRTAVKQSLIHELSGVAELVLEGGAGPTVRRSFNEPAYFAMIVQLSLLTFTHELTSLTKALTRSFERRAQGASEYVAPPRYDALIGTLRAVREQTCGFMWELILSAVEKKLYPSILWTDGTLYILRTIPQVILQALMDSFTAIQHLPENTRLRIRSRAGIPTIIVWAHQVLGLTVTVDIDDQSHVFGEGPPTIYIDDDVRGQAPAEVTLLNETDDAFFHLAADTEDPRLAPVPRHPIKDYGTRMLRLKDNDAEREKQMVFAIVTSCLAVAKEQNRDRDIKRLEESRFVELPVQRVLEVSKLLFNANEETITAIDLSSELPCAARKAHLDNPPGIPMIFGSGRAVLYLCHVVLVLCMAQGFDEELGLHLDALDKTAYLPFSMPDARRSFSSLASLLQGFVYHLTDSTSPSASVLSDWGWSLCLSSVVGQDLSDVRPEVAFIRGVPARGGERKRRIVDGVGPLAPELNAGFRAAYRSHIIPVAGPGEVCTLESWTRPQKTRHLIGVTNDAFEVVKVIGCDSAIPKNKVPENMDLKAYSVSFGFRSMQELYWCIAPIPPCGHSAALGQSVILPDGVWTFHGHHDGLAYSAHPSEGVFAGLVAGDSSARWILAAVMMHSWTKGKDPLRMIYIRGRGCCLDCAIRYAKNGLQGRRVGLVL